MCVCVCGVCVGGGEVVVGIFLLLKTGDFARRMPEKNLLKLTSKIWFTKKLAYASIYL